MTTGTIVIDKPNGIKLFQYKSAISAIRLEKMGMKHSRGSVRKNWAVHLGLNARAKHDVVIAKLEEKVKELVDEGNLGIREV